MLTRLGRFEHQFAHPDRLFSREDGLNDAINIKRHIALKRPIVAIRAIRQTPEISRIIFNVMSPA
jgi:hypothetical protein